MAKKKRFRSAPRIVTGRDNDRCTLLIRLVSAIPAGRRCFRCREKAKIGNSLPPWPSDAEKHAGKHTLRAAFTEGEGEPGHDNRDQGSPRAIVLENTSASSDQGQSCCHFPSLPVGEESSESLPLILLMGKKPAKSFKEKCFTF
jgi:hypothetical protein